MPRDGKFMNCSGENLLPPPFLPPDDDFCLSCFLSSSARFFSLFKFRPATKVLELIKITDEETKCSPGTGEKV